jgi:hypothetical protein
MKLSASLAIADACGISLDWLAAGRGSKAGEWINPAMHGQPPLGPQPDGTFVEIGPAMPFAGMQDAPPVTAALPSNRLNVSALAKAIEIIEAVVGIEAFRDNPKGLAERIATTYALLTRPDLDKSPPMAEP